MSGHWSLILTCGPLASQESVACWLAGLLKLFSRGQLSHLSSQAGKSAYFSAYFSAHNKSNFTRVIGVVLGLRSMPAGGVPLGAWVLPGAGTGPHPTQHSASLSAVGTEPCQRFGLWLGTPEAETFKTQCISKLCRWRFTCCLCAL